MCAVLFLVFDAAGFSLMAFREVSSKVKYNSLRLASSDAIFVSLRTGIQCPGRGFHRLVRNREFQRSEIGIIRTGITGNPDLCAHWISPARISSVTLKEDCLNILYKWWHSPGARSPQSFCHRSSPTEPWIRMCSLSLRFLACSSMMQIYREPARSFCRPKQRTLISPSCNQG